MTHVCFIRIFFGLFDNFIQSIFSSLSPETITGGTSNATAAVLSFYRGGTVETTYQDEAETKATLPETANLEESAEDFPKEKDTIEEGSILTCHVLKMGGASNVTIQLELLSLEEGN